MTLGHLLNFFYKILLELCYLQHHLLNVNSYFSALAYVDSAIQDPCRPGVKDAVQLCQNAGVKVYFVR